ncbi:MAG: TetR/AcrR family transcriptional regulator [Acidimicrobiia bacterium]|nr:TetR/AcrR family transcriptional regulator [Acidimicrobiia bacterium]
MIASACDPRIERSRSAIHSATIEELAEVGYGAMTIESIARRAGVGKATIYRHWRGKLDLVASALETIKEDVVAPTEGTVRARVTTVLEALAVHLADSDLARCLPALISAAQYDDGVREFQRGFSRERRGLLIALLDEGIASGELSADLDPELAAAVLAGPLFYSRLLSHEPFPPGRVAQVVALVLG